MKLLMARIGTSHVVEQLAEGKTGTRVYHSSMGGYRASTSRKWIEGSIVDRDRKSVV